MQAATPTQVHHRHTGCDEHDRHRDQPSSFGTGSWQEAFTGGLSGIRLRAEAPAGTRGRVLIRCDSRPRLRLLRTPWRRSVTGLVTHP